MMNTFTVMLQFIVPDLSVFDHYNSLEWFVIFISTPYGDSAIHQMIMDTPAVTFSR
jgi:hypothetical protein